MLKTFGDERDWFFKKRLGIFVHWGLYAVSAWHEQEQLRRKIPRSNYEKLIDKFNPNGFDPDTWLDLVQKAGMEYICFTTKHHDGFCLWDTKQTDYNIMNSPYHTDVLSLLAKACHKRDFPLCLYYSVVDWHHPNYPNQGRSHELTMPEPGDIPDINKYMSFLRAQITELCKNYGEIHGFWWDMNVTGIYTSDVNDLIRSLQPAAVVNDRGFDNGDFITVERENNMEAVNVSKPMESCNSVGMTSWGYRKNEDYYSDRFLIKSIDSSLAKGGNYLLNVGPDANGVVPYESTRILHKIGNWYSSVKEAFIDTIPFTELIDDPAVLLTVRNNNLYIHLNEYPIGSRILIKRITRLPCKARILNTGKQVETSLEVLPGIDPEKPCLRVYNVPINDIIDTVIIIKLTFDDCNLSELVHYE